MHIEQQAQHQMSLSVYVHQQQHAQVLHHVQQQHQVCLLLLFNKSAIKMHLKRLEVLSVSLRLIHKHMPIVQR